MEQQRGNWHHDLFATKLKYTLNKTSFLVIEYGDFEYCVIKREIKEKFNKLDKTVLKFLLVN